MSWSVDKGEEARLTPEGPTAAVILSRGPLPLRVRSTLGSAAFGRQHAGSAVVLGKDTYETVAEESSGGSVVYRLEPWPRDQPIRDRVTYGPRLVRAAQEQRRQMTLERWAGPLMGAVRGILEVFAALLPAEERRATVERLGLDAVRGTTVLVGLQVFGCGTLWILGLIAAGRANIDAVAGEYRRAGKTPSQEEIVAAYSGQTPAALGVLNYALSPTGFALGYLFLTGVVRALNLASTRQPLADPILALALGARRRIRSKALLDARLAELGPERPDRTQDDGSDLVVISAREKPEWNERATIQMDDRFFRVRHVEDRADGQWKAISYRLTPLEKGIVIRELVHYRPPETRSREAPTEGRPAQRLPSAAQPSSRVPPSEPQAPAEPALPVKPPAREIAGLDSSRTRWRVDDGEEAQLTPDGPSAAQIDSLGSLPLRPRSQALGVHHRPEFPGTCVVLGGARFEVVEEQPLDTGFRYLLDPWPREAIFRDAVEYGPKLVQAAQRERERAVFREQSAGYSKWLLPIFGLLPESRQVILCERYGLDAAHATLNGAIFEGLLGLLVLAALNAKSYGLAVAFAPPLGLCMVFPAIGRGIAALAWQEVGGSALLGAAFNLSQGWKHVTQRFDPMVLPVTREAFWARLGLPDRQERQQDGSLIVRSVLPHLSWAPNVASRLGGRPPVIQAGEDYWNAASLPPVIERGRLTYVYHLWPVRDAEMRTDLPDPRPPDPRHYQEDVREGVAREWDDIFRVAPWLPTLLSAEVQERAYRQRGAATAARRWAVITAALELLLAVWFFAGRGGFNVLTGALLVWEGGFRLWRTLEEKFAPSFLGWLLSDYLRPERVAYHAHRDAERETLLALRKD